MVSFGIIKLAVAEIKDRIPQNINGPIGPSSKDHISINGITTPPNLQTALFKLEAVALIIVSYISEVNGKIIVKEIVIENFVKPTKIISHSPFIR